MSENRFLFIPNHECSFGATQTDLSAAVADFACGHSDFVKTLPRTQVYALIGHLEVKSSTAGETDLAFTPLQPQDEKETQA